MKYILNSKTEDPEFSFLIRDSYCKQYWLFNSFSLAIETLKWLSIGKNEFYFMCEPEFNTYYRDWRSITSFSALNGEVFYDKAQNCMDLHMEYYVRAGEWMNPNEDVLQNKRKEIQVQKSLEAVQKILGEEENG